MSVDGGRFRGAPATATVTAVTVLASTLVRVIIGARWRSVEAWAIETSTSTTVDVGARACAMATRAFGFCASTGEFLVGTSLLSSVGTRLERASGTRRFAGAALALVLVSVVVKWTLGVGVEKDACGPYALVFGLMRVYATETPTASSSREFVVTDKMVKYFGACMLAVSNGRRSMRAALVGTFAGYVLTDGVGTTHEALALTAPRWWPRRRSRPIVRMRARAPRASENDSGEGLVPPTEENVRVLTSMGFDETAARRALQRANDDVQRASDFLLSG